MKQIDRRAWAVSRPNKPTDLDESSWAATVRDEIADINPDLVIRRMPISVDAARVEYLDLDLLAAMAVVDADECSTSCGGRFSAFDIRAGATRALSRTGIIAAREQLDEVIAEITSRARESVVRLIEKGAPAHVKGYVGLTRGRIRNRAITVARTDDAAHANVAESMLRGTPELTMQDAVLAAEAELRRAARERALAPVVGAAGVGSGMGI